MDKVSNMKIPALNMPELTNIEMKMLVCLIPYCLKMII